MSTPTPTLFRWHRGHLADSMATQRPITGRAELVSIINAEYGQRPVTEDDITVEFYGHDDRIGQDCYIVTAHGAVLGWTNKMI